MKRSIPPVLSSLLFLLSLSVAAAQEFPVDPDLVPLTETGIATLNSRWYFIPGKFIDPSSDAIPEGAFPVSFPVNVKAYLSQSDQRFGSFMRIARTPQMGGLAVQSGQFSTAFALYADGLPVFSAGKPGMTVIDEKPGWTAGVHDLPSQANNDGQIIFIIHASAFNDSYFGFSAPLAVGLKETLLENRLKKVAWDFFTVGILLVMATYFLFVRISNHRQKAALAFSCLCFSLTLRPLLYGQFSVYYLWPRIPFQILFRGGYLTMSIAIAATAAFFHYMFPRTMPRVLTAAGLAVGAGYSLIVMTAPIMALSVLLPYVQLAMIALAALILVFTAIAAAHRETGSVIILCGFFLMFITIVLDVLSSIAVISSPTLTPIGLVVLILFFSVAMARGSAVAYNKAENLARELEITNESMKRFVPSEFLDHLGHDHFYDIQLGEHVEKDMAVMFADIRSFSVHAEELGSDGTFEFLNDWLGLMGPVIRAHGGFVDKYIGDGILALFPVERKFHEEQKFPVERKFHEEPQVSAIKAEPIQCAVSMMREMEKLNDDRRESGFSAIDIGIGIHLGRLALGTVGEPLRMETTVIADTVNIAARLESVTKEFGVPIVVSAEVLETAAGREHAVRYLGKVTVKGIKKPIDVHEIFDSDDDAHKYKKATLLSRFEEGIALFTSFDFEKALPVFQSLIEEMPKDLPSHYYARMSRKMKN